MPVRPDPRKPRSWREAVWFAVSDRWPGRHFQERVARVIIEYPPLETTWRLGGLDLPALVDELGATLRHVPSDENVLRRLMGHDVRADVAAKVDEARAAGRAGLELLGRITT